jgi:hypothetical protein
MLVDKTEVGESPPDCDLRPEKRPSMSALGHF